MNDLVVRLHRALIEAMQQRAVRLDHPVTVAEIYQDLIPYRLVRSVGFALNADYEFALLQLLAGEGNLARIEPQEVREELRLELLSPNPNVGMFRQYAACDVFVSGEDGAEAAASRTAEPRKQEGAAQRPNVPPDWLLREQQRAGAAKETADSPAPRSATDKAQREEASPTPASSAAAMPAPRPAPTPQAKPEPAKSKTTEVNPEPVAKPTAPAKAIQAPGGATTTSCSACGRALPGGRSVRFCPYCGKEQGAKCGNCGEEMEPAWRFCVACGTPT